MGNSSSLNKRRDTMNTLKGFSTDPDDIVDHLPVDGLADNNGVGEQGHDDDEKQQCGRC